MTDLKLPTSQVFGFDIYAGSAFELETKLTEHLKSKESEPLVIFTPNPEQIIQADQDREFSLALQEADILIPDGIGLVMASKVLQSKGSKPLAHRIAGVDLALYILKASSKQNIALIGGRDYSDKDLVRWPNLTWLPGYDNVRQPTSQEEEELVTQLKKIKPAVVMVAFGAPYQEKWVMSHLPLLKQLNVKLVMVVGGAFDMLTGQTPRSPEVWRRLGLEWLYRLLQQPWRWKRQLRLITFSLKVWQSFLFGK